MIYPLGKDYPVIVTTDTKTYRQYCKARKNNDFRWFTFEMVGITNDTKKALCHNADDRDVSQNGWYAHSREHGYNYRRENNRKGIRVIDINTYKE